MAFCFPEVIINFTVSRSFVAIAPPQKSLIEKEDQSELILTTLLILLNRIIVI